MGNARNLNSGQTENKKAHSWDSPEQLNILAQDISSNCTICLWIRTLIKGVSMTTNIISNAEEAPREELSNLEKSGADWKRGK